MTLLVLEYTAGDVRGLASSSLRVLQCKIRMFGPGSGLENQLLVNMNLGHSSSPDVFPGHRSLWPYRYLNAQKLTNSIPKPNAGTT